MKVLFYSHTSKISGAENILLLLIEKLDKRKFESTAVCAGKGSLPDRISELGVPSVSTEDFEARFSVNPFKLIGYLRSTIGAALALRKHVDVANPDLIHANSIRAGLVSTAATTGRSIPVYWHLQDDIGTHPISTLIRLFVAFSRRVRLVAASGATLDSFRGVLLKVIGRKTPAEVLHNVVDASKFKFDPDSRKLLRYEFGADDETFLLGTIGQVTPRKGQLELIRAFAKCLDEGLNGKLLIIGSPMFNSDDEYFTLLKHEAEALGIEKSVVFTGFRKDVPEILCALDTVVINSKSEAFVVVGIEGLAAGTPVIATDVGGIREMLTDGENGLVISFGDQKELQNAITRLSSDDRLRAMFAINGMRVISERLNADVFIQKIESFFESKPNNKKPQAIKQMKGAESSA